MEWLVDQLFCLLRLCSCFKAIVAEPTLFVHDWGYFTCGCQVVIEPKPLVV